MEKNGVKFFFFWLELRFALNLLSWNYKARNQMERRLGQVFELKSREV